MQNIKKYFMTLALLLTAVTGAMAQTETLLTTITPTAKEQASYSTANVATVSFSHTADGSSAYLANWGWWGYGWSATVNAAEGYTITKCIFYDDQERKATDSEAPFVVETTDGDKTPRVNGTPILADQSKGIKKIEVYGYKSEPTEWSLTPDETGKNWTLAEMPASNVELQVEYFAESNLFLSNEALADKGSIAVTAGDLGVQFGEDGKSANTVTEGTAMTVKFNGTKKLLGMKVEKKAAATPLDNTTTAWTAGTFAVPAGGLTYSDAITVSGDVTLTLTDGETLTLNKGISLASGATLTIQGNGAMVVNGTSGSTASTVAGSTGTLILTSGTLTATGGNGQDMTDSQQTGASGGAAINGSVTVNGGSLTANGGNGGNCIGRAMDFTNGGAGGAAISGDVTITDGAVAATGGNGGNIQDNRSGYSVHGGAGGTAIGGNATLTGGTLTTKQGADGTETGRLTSSSVGTGGKAVAGTVTNNGGTVNQ